jgi:hypothetical protein
MKTFRTIAFVLGGVLTGIVMLGLIGIVVSVVIGVREFQAGHQEAAAWAKLACVLCMGVSGIFAVPGTFLLVAGVVCHRVLRRRG